MSWLESARILVTGGAGFLGKNVAKKLEERGCKNIFIPLSENYDLVQMEAVKRLYHDSKPDVVIHLAARVGGIGANRKIIVNRQYLVREAHRHHPFLCQWNRARFSRNP